MNKDIDLIEILKDAPKGTKLWSPICGWVTLESIKNDTIIVSTWGIGKIEYETFDKFGCWLNSLFAEYTECTLFPSKENRDWSTFKAPWKHKHFEPYQKVLVHGIVDNTYYWFANFYSHYDKKYKIYVLIDGQTIHDDEYIIPYEGNEDKLGKPVKS